MTKKPKKPISKKAPALDVFTIRLPAAGIAEALGLSVARVNQLRREGGLKAGDGGLYSLVDALRSHYLYDSPRGENARAAARERNSRALERETFTRLRLRKLLTIGEVAQITRLIFEDAYHIVQAESSRFYSEYHAENDEQSSLGMTHRLFDPLVRMANAWRDRVSDLLREIDAGHMPLDSRLDDLIDRIRADMAEAVRADAMPTAAEAGS